jgi:hypothetical protein
MRVVFEAFTLDLDRRELCRQDQVQPLRGAHRNWRCSRHAGHGRARGWDRWSAWWARRVLASRGLPTNASRRLVPPAGTPCRPSPMGKQCPITPSFPCCGRCLAWRTRHHPPNSTRRSTRAWRRSTPPWRQTPPCWRCCWESLSLPRSYRPWRQRRSGGGSSTPVARCCCSRRLTPPCACGAGPGAAVSGHSRDAA